MLKIHIVMGDTITKKDLTIVEVESYKRNRLQVMVTKFVFYYPAKKELHGKTIKKAFLDGGIDGGINIGVVGDKEVYIGTNNVEDRKLRNILPRIKNARMVKCNVYDDYVDDPYGRLVPRGKISAQTWDISRILE